MWTIRPSLHRVAAVGIASQVQSGVRFRKGVGLVGLCIANNDRTEFLTLAPSSARYESALRASTDSEWRALGTGITHNLGLADAGRLAHSYGQVIAKVIQDENSGEAIGCATISVQRPSTPTLQLARHESVRRNLTDLSLTLGVVLATQRLRFRGWQHRAGWEA